MEPPLFPGPVPGSSAHIVHKGKGLQATISHSGLCFSFSTSPETQHKPRGEDCLQNYLVPLIVPKAWVSASLRKSRYIIYYIITNVITLGSGRHEGRVICDPMSEVTSGRISRNVALGWGKERLLVTIELPNTSKCHPGPDKRLAPSKCSRGDG